MTEIIAIDKSGLYLEYIFNKIKFKLYFPESFKNPDYRFAKIKPNKKVAFENWTKTNYRWDEIQDYEGNIAIINKYGSLLVIDADSKEISDLAKSKLPPTLTVQSSNDYKLHFYYHCPNTTIDKLVFRDNLGDVRGYNGNYYTVIPPSIHPDTGKLYRVINDQPINDIDEKTILDVLGKYVVNTDQITEKDNFHKIGSCNYDITKVIDISGFVKQHDGEYQGPNPIIGSTTGHNINVNTGKNIFRDWHYQVGGKTTDWIALKHGLIKYEDWVKLKLQRKILTDTIFDRVCEIGRKEYGFNIFDPNNVPSTLDDVHERLKAWLYLESTDYIDVILATALSNQHKGTPVWMFIMGDSSCGKSAILKTLKSYSNAIPIDRLTANTLASGHKEGKLPTNDLGFYLNNSSHILVFTDLACMKSINKDEKNEIWGQFRNLYDGDIFKRTGNGVNKSYENCHVTVIAGTTLDLANEFSLANQLGTRELTYGVSISEDARKRAVEKTITQIGQEDAMKKDMRDIIQGFLSTREFKIQEISPDMQKFLITSARDLSILRANATFERISGELSGNVSVEVPTRCVQQFIVLYHAFKSLDENYPTRNIKRIIDNIVRTSADMVRYDVLNFFRKHQESDYSLLRLHQFLTYGKKTIKRQCEVLVNLGILEKSFKPVTAENGHSYDLEFYTYNKDSKYEKIEVEAANHAFTLLSETH